MYLRKLLGHKLGDAEKKKKRVCGTAFNTLSLSEVGLLGTLSKVGEEGLSQK